MDEFTFNIPTNLDELLEDFATYPFHQLLPFDEVIAELNQAHILLREEGPEFPINNFHLFVSIFKYSAKLSSDVLDKAFNLVIKAGNLIDKLIENNSSCDEIEDNVKVKLQNLLKILFFLLSQFVRYFQERSDNASKKDTAIQNKCKVLNIISTILQRNVNKFWTPAMAEYQLINVVANICYDLLKDPKISREKPLILEIFGVCGCLIKDYNYGMTFCNCLVKLIRSNNHLVFSLNEGIKLIFTEFNCKNFIHFLVKDLIDWQVNATVQCDAAWTKNSCSFLITLAEIFPNELMEDFNYLSDVMDFGIPHLQSAILTCMTEILIKLSQKRPNMNVEQPEEVSDEIKRIRQHCFDELQQNLRNVNQSVRAKCIQSISKLKSENVLMKRNEIFLLNDIVVLLAHKAAIVRKAAIQCVCTFIEFNSYGPCLNIVNAVEESKRNEQESKSVLVKYKDAVEEFRKKREDFVKDNQNDIHEAILNYLNKPRRSRGKENVPNGDTDNEESEENEDDEQEAEEEEDSDEKTAFFTTFEKLMQKKKFNKVIENVIKYLANSHDVEIDLMNENRTQTVEKMEHVLMQLYGTDALIFEDLLTNSILSAEDMSQHSDFMKKIEMSVFRINFIASIENAFPTMKKLLCSTVLSDMQEAVTFFVLAHKFEIRGAYDGVQEMLKLLGLDDPQRKTAISQALKVIYLETNMKNASEHACEVLKRFIIVYNDLTLATKQGFESLISDWADKGTMDNLIIDMAWKYYTNQVQVSVNERIGACEILRMCSLGKPSIVGKNISVVQTILSQLGESDMALYAASVKLLVVAFRLPIDINSKTPPNRISFKDSLFILNNQVLIDCFFKPIPHYSEALRNGIELIFKTSSKPIYICEDLMKSIMRKFNLLTTKQNYHIIRMCQLNGYVSLNLMVFLDVTVYRELKRRNNVKEAKKDEEKAKAQSLKKQKNKRQSAINCRSMMEDSSLNGTSVETEHLEGAIAEDTDAEFILAELDNETSSSTTLLGSICSQIVKICQAATTRNNVALQLASIDSLVHSCLLSSKLCSRQMQLVFSILEETKYAQVKCNILTHCIDLLTRFPNIVEPWFSRVYKFLHVEDEQIRRSALFTITTLTLKDMVRPKEHMADIATCVLDEDEKVKQSAIIFFTNYNKKSHNLQNIIPDIVGQMFLKNTETGVLRQTISLLFGLLEEQKKPESTVEKLCSKFTLDNMEANRNVIYCLSMVQFNHKALKVLLDKFRCYRQHLHDTEIYGGIKTILDNGTKIPNGQPIVEDIQKAINEVFESADNGRPPRPNAPKSVRKKGPGRRGKRKASESD